MKPVVCSFSGGRTSAFMARMLSLACRAEGRRFICVMANTGEEDPRTLAFSRRCDEAFGRGIVLLEAVVDPAHGAGTTHQIVDWDTATRPWTPATNAVPVFEQVIQKYGIPNKAFPNCNRELKLRPIYSYLRSIGIGPCDADHAVGIRADEVDRISKDAAKSGIFYPLVKWGITKPDVLAFWRSQEFDLYLPEHLGNCRWCWKKSKRKHLTLMRDNPEMFAFPERMEALYPDAGAGDGGRVFFRGKESVADLRAQARQPFEPFVDGNEAFDPDLDVAGGDDCVESCDVRFDLSELASGVTQGAVVAFGRP